MINKKTNKTSSNQDDCGCGRRVKLTNKKKIVKKVIKNR